MNAPKPLLLSGQNILRWLPYLYFFVFFVLVNTPGNTGFLLILSLPFVLQLFFQFKYVDIILSILTFILSVWLMLAYLSDLYKVTIVTNQTRRFIGIGALVVLSNFAMCVLLFRNGENRFNRQKERGDTIQGSLG